MKLLLYYYLPALITCIEAVMSPHNVWINCSWPCPNAADGCIVTTQGATCSTRDSQSWMIHSPEKAPIYTGASISIQFQPCQLVPIPTLPFTNVTVGPSVIIWPIANLRKPQDEYLGNCGHGLYCSGESNPVCRQRFSIASSCFSSNQCQSSLCTSGTCRQATNDRGHGRKHHDTQQNSSTTITVAQILASVFGIMGAGMIAIAGFVFYRSYKTAAVNQEEIADHSTLPPLDLHKQFASDFLHDDTPAVQQRQLDTTMLQNQDDTCLVPPPYKP